ncbi:MAG: hypothetical protein LAT76_04205 [Schleiferiaceae bacterium]|nr:hypothetical protein [Schleiferiaceae bacterium]
MIRSFLFFSLLVVFFSTFSACKRDAGSVVELLDAVPAKSSVVIRFQDVSKGLNSLIENPVIISLDTLQAFASWKKALLPLEGLLQDSTGKKIVVPALAAVHISGGRKYEVVWIAEEQRSVLRQFRKLGQETHKRKYEDTDIITIKTKDQNTWSYATYKGVLTVSTSENLIEEVIKQIDSPAKISNDPYFSKAFESINKRDAVNVLLNFDVLPAFSEWAMPKTGHHWLRSFGSWSAFDFSGKKDQLLLSGITLYNDSSYNYLSTFKKNGPKPFKAQEIMPLQTAAFVALSVENFAQYQRSYIEFLNYHNKGNTYRRHQEDLGFDAAQLFQKHIQNEWGIFYTESKKPDLYTYKFAYMATPDGEKAVKDFTSISGTTQIDNYRGLPVYRLGVSSLLPHTLGQLFWGMNDVYLVTWENYLVFGNTYDQIKGLINDWLADKTLANDLSFKSFANEFPGRGHIWTAGTHPASAQYGVLLFENSVANDWGKKAEALSDVKWFGAHFRVSDQAAFTNIIAIKKTETETDARRQWVTPLQSKVALQPTWVKNHYTQNQEIFLQDESNRIYLIDNAGSILWKRQLDAVILGEVNQIDILKNNKLQLVFNTATHLYVLDRNGNNVAPFPVKLPTAATAGVGVFDYDKNRNYRFVVPCGNRLLNYGVDGAPVRGWSFNNAVSDIKQIPRHILVGTKDYILVVESAGKVRLLNRKGEDRVAIPGTFSLAQRELFLVDGKNPDNARLIGLTASGKLLNLFFNGKIDSLDAGLGNAGVLLTRNDGLLLAGDRKLQWKDSEQPWEVRTPMEIEIGPYIFERNKGYFVGAGSLFDNQIWLYDNLGKLQPGFPVYGATPFTVGAFDKGGSQLLIVGATDGSLICYRME